MPDSREVFILTGENVDFKGKNFLRFIGTTNQSEPVEIILTENRPYFFIDSDAEISFNSLRFIREKSNLKSFNGESVDKIFYNTRKDLRAASDKFQSENVKTFEADVDPVRRFLMDGNINSQVFISGESQSVNRMLRFKNPQIRPCNVNPKFKIVSLDIETGVKNSILYSIAVHLTGNGEEQKTVFILGDKNKQLAENIFQFNSEKELINNFISWFKAADPDIIIGWHVIGFDLMFLERKCNELFIPFDLARGKGRVSLRARKPSGYFASISGRIVIDGPPVLRGSFFTFEDYKLDTIAQELLGVGKTISQEQNKVEEIEKLFKEDKVKLAEYNIQDAVLVTGIFKKTGVLELSVKRSQISGLLMDQLGMMTAAFDHFYLPRLHEMGFVAPNIKDINPAGHAAGGYVLDPKPGIYDDVIVLDFKSLYPSIIQTFKIDPLSRLLNEKDTINTPAGYKFSASNHILPGYINGLMTLRAEAKKKGEKQLSQAIKILMNSFYGVMGSYGCRFFHPDLPSAITNTGQWLLLGSKEFLEKSGYEVVYGDTDSLFVKLKSGEGENAKLNGEHLADELNNYWRESLLKRFNVNSFLEIEYEKYYRKFIITPARGSESGAKKRYAGLLVENNEEKLEFVGMEFVRSDWTRLAKEFQVELYDKVFHNKEITSWLRNLIDKINRGKFDDKLVYRKRLRKDTNDYVKNIPPHVRAAKMIDMHSGTVYYVVTQRGPIPIELKHNDIDYQHYIEKQIKPIADSVLTLLGESFDSIIKSGQLNIFES